MVIMPKGKYRGISLFRDLVDEVESFVKKHPQAGYKTVTEFCADAIRRRMEEVKQHIPARPALEHFNVNQDHVTVIDHKRRMFADVYFRNGRVYCELCEEEDCEHVKYALSLSKVQRALERKGWERR